MQPHLEAMYRFAYRLAGQQQDAEDLVQDVVLKLYPRLSELESVEQLRPWLNRVLYRHFIDQVRRKGRRADRPVSDVAEPEQRNLMLLHDVDGWSQEDIAQVLEIPVGTVKSRVHRCRAALREKLLERPELFPQAERVKE